MNFSKLDFGLSEFFDPDYNLTWQDGTLGYSTLANGQDGLSDRFVTDSSIFLNHFYSNFISLIDKTELTVFSVSSYKLEGMVDGKLFGHRNNQSKENIYQLIVLHGNDNITYNTHDVSNLLEHNEVDGATELSYYTKLDVGSSDSNALSASAVPITAQYKNCSFIANVSVPASFTNQSGTGYVTCITFPDTDSLHEAFAKYIV